MLFSRDKVKMVEPEQALSGRDESMRIPAKHDVLGTPIAPPFPEGLEQVQLGMGCFWGAERIFWRLPGVYTTAVGYAGGYTPNPTYEEVCSAQTGHAEVVLVVFDPEQISFDEILRAFWEGHDPTQGMRQGNDVGTQYRSALYWTTDAQRRGGRGVARPLRREAPRRRLRRDHDGARARRAVLLRRAVPPAVPRQEPERLLRHRRHGRLLPGRRRRLAERLAGTDCRHSEGAAAGRPLVALLQMLLTERTCLPGRPGPGSGSCRGRSCPARRSRTPSSTRT